MHHTEGVAIMGKMSELVILKSVMLEAQERAAKAAAEFHEACADREVKPNDVPPYDTEEEAGEFIELEQWCILYAYGMVIEDNDVLDGACQMTGHDEFTLMDQFETLAQRHNLDLEQE